MPAFAFTLQRRQVSQSLPNVRNRPGISQVSCDEEFTVLYGDPSVFDRARENRAIGHAGVTVIMQNRISGEIEIRSDPTGAYPVVVKVSHDAVHVASNVAHLIQILPESSRAADPAALEELLAFGQLLEDRTTVEDAIHLTAGARLRIDSETVRRDIAGHAPPDTTARSFDAVVSSLVDTVARQAGHAGDALMLPISGGLDTRLLLAACLAAGFKPELCVFGSPESADRRIGESIASKFGLPCRAFDIAPDQAVWRASRVAEASGGELPLQHGHALLANGFEQAISGRALMVGSGGETFRAFYYDRGMPGFSWLGSRGTKPLFRHRCRRYAMEHIANGATDIPAALTGPLAQRIDEILASSSNLARGLDRVYLEIRVRRSVMAGQQILNRHCLRLHPLLDPGVQQGFSGLPASMGLAGRFHRRAISQLEPKLATICWDRTERPMSDGLKWNERWPGLATRLGVKGDHAKIGAPLCDYRRMLDDHETDSLIASLDHSGLITSSSRTMLKPENRNPSRIGALKSFALFAMQSLDQARRAIA